MSEPLLLYLALLGLCVLLSAFFSGSEAAFLSLQRVRLLGMVRRKVPGVGRVARLAHHPERLLPTVLLGNMVVNTAAASLGTAVALAFLRSEQKAVVAATVGISLLLLLLGEMLPKSLAIRHAEGASLLLVRPLEWAERALFPLALALQGVTRPIARVFGGQGLRAVVTEEELRALISVGQESGVVTPHEAALLENVFRFGDRRVREVMTPRPEMVWVEKGATFQQVLELFHRHPYSRFPVLERGTERPLGVLWMKDLWRATAVGKLSPQDDATRLARTPFCTPESKPIASLFQEMRETGRGMAIVVDEFGGVAGLVTLTQLVEQVVGPVTEEARAEEEVVPVGQDTFEVDGGMLVEEANERLGLSIPPGDYETVAGFLLERMGRVPREGDTLLHDGHTFTVAQMEGIRVARVRVARPPPGPHGGG